MAELHGENYATNGIRPFSAHFGLPCGTCSRAPEIPLSKKMKAGAPEPPPLRGHAYLLGVPGLRGTDATRVEAATQSDLP